MGKPTSNGKQIIRCGNQLGVRGPNVRNLGRNWNKAIITRMTLMRFQGKTPAECDEWLENFIQEVERMEREGRND